MNGVFTDAVEYYLFWVIKKPSHYEDDVANNLSRVTQKVSVLRKDKNIGRKGPELTIACLQDVKVAFDVGSIHQKAAFWPFKHLLRELVNSLIKARVMLSTKTSKAQDGCLTIYFTVVDFLLKRRAIVGNILIIAGDIWNFRKGTVRAT